MKLVMIPSVAAAMLATCLEVLAATTVSSPFVGATVDGACYHPDHGHRMQRP